MLITMFSLLAASCSYSEGHLQKDRDVSQASFYEIIRGKPTTFFLNNDQQKSGSMHVNLRFSNSSECHIARFLDQAM